MKKILKLLLPFFSFLLMISQASAGPYAPAAGQAGSTAIHMNDGALIAWATGWVNYIPGTHLDAKWKTPQKALGKAKGDSYDICGLGRGGFITMTFDKPISNGTGWDFAIFENSFSDDFLELAYVEVSANGTDFFRFYNRSLTSQPVTGYGTVDPTDVDGLAGKYRQGYGTPFDLAAVGLSSATHVRIVDIIGNGAYFDSVNHVIYDPYPTSGTAGFDLDAVGVIHQGASPSNPPSVTTSNANGISTNSARLNGTVNPNGSSTTYYFQYGLTAAYGSTTGSQNAGQGSSALSVNAWIAGLTSDTTYHFRIVANNTAGTSWGYDRTFKTEAPPQEKPSVTTSSADNITVNAARLNGTVNPNGSSTTYYFQYGLTAAYGSTTGSQNAGSGSASVSVSADISGLTFDSTYHFRIVAQNSAGKSYGSDRTFITDQPPPSNTICVIPPGDSGNCGGCYPCKSSIADAVDYAMNTAPGQQVTINLAVGEYYEGINAVNPKGKTVNFLGGWLSDFSGPAQANTIMKGGVKTTGGKFIVNKIVIRPR
jgi:hypothetical protein